MAAQTYHFGPFQLDRDARLLLRGGEAVALAPKTFDLLTLLTENRGRALSRTEIMAALWPDTISEEGNLSFQISILRKALGPEGAKCIETLPRHGYRFRAPAVGSLPPATVTHQTSRRRIWISVSLALVVAMAALWLLLPGREAYGPVTSEILTAYRGSETSAAFSPDGNSVAFMWDQGEFGRYNIFIREPGVETPRQFTSASDFDFSPAWSPDGHTIAFMRRLSDNSARYMVKPYPDGAERILLTTGNCVPGAFHLRVLAWHPDSKHLIIPDPEGGQPCGLVAFSTETGTITRLTDPPHGRSDFEPAVSPDGRQLAFIRGAGFPELVLWAARLSADLKAPQPAWIVNSATAGVDLSPAWTTDSKELVFASGNSTSGFALFRTAASGAHKARPIPGAGPIAMWPSVSSQGSLAFSALGTGSASLWEMELQPDGSEPLLREVAASSHMQQEARYSPDGDRILFESERSGHHEVWTSQANGSSVHQVTNLGEIAQSPQWSPDGNRVVFSATVDRQRELYMVNVDGRFPKRLTDNPADDTSGCWSPDGRWIYFQSNRSGEYEIWRTPADGGPAVQITHAVGMSPRLSPDATWLYYRKRNSLWRMALSGGQEYHLVDDLAFDNVVPFDDGFFFLAAGASAGRTIESKLEFYNLADGTARTVAIIPGLIGWGLSVSRDRRKFLITRSNTKGADLRLLRRF